MNRKKSNIHAFAKKLFSKRLYNTIALDIDLCNSFTELGKIAGEVLYGDDDFPLWEIVDNHCDKYVARAIALDTIEYIVRRCNNNDWMIDPMSKEEFYVDMIYNVSIVDNCDELLLWVREKCQWNTDYLEEVLDSIYN